MEAKSLRDPKESPVLSFLHREMTGALGLIATVHRNLGLLARFLRGSQAFSQELDGIIRSLLRDETPVAWLAQWRTGPEDCSTFLRSTIAKTQALKVMQL